MLFAVETEEGLAYTALGTLISGVVTAIVWGVIKIMNANHQNSTEVRVWSLGEAQKIITDLRESNAKLETRTASLETSRDEFRGDLEECKREREVMSRWIGWAQPEMEKAGIRVPQFDLNDSQTHVPVSDETPNPKRRRP